jgi:hypothetical protein
MYLNYILTIEHILLPKRAVRFDPRTSRTVSQTLDTNEAKRAKEIVLCLQIDSTFNTFLPIFV